MEKLARVDEELMVEADEGDCRKRPVARSWLLRIGSLPSTRLIREEQVARRHSGAQRRRREDRGEQNRT